ncbi:hypothetical protein HAHE_22820 [Haloferula helveola]|uniref:DUF4129 domain-containing protein n=1 Tax=Haloferula helveola TaxID=490095 RepID=A0ABN6H6X8_9BACT|nr:hypothetical protein HAHE_22820 [Haloferula helveola]
MKAALSMLIAMVLPVAAAPDAPDDVSDPNAIGIEEGTRVVLERDDYIPRPLDDRTPLIVRLGEVSPVEDGYSYRFHFIGFEPGEYRLADFLMRADGTPAEELGDRTVTVKTILPADHDGSLTPHVPSTFPWFGGYRTLLIGLGVVWVLGWIALAWFGRRRRAADEAVQEPPPPTFAERLRPYVEAAAGGELDSREQAELERLLSAYWRDRLKLPEQRMASELAELRKHPEAGELIRALEGWLHRPGGVSPERVDDLLAPYRTPVGEEVRA